MTSGVRPGCWRSAPAGIVAVWTGRGRPVTTGLVAAFAPPSRIRRPTIPATDDATATAPAWTRNPRRDQSIATTELGAPVAVRPAPPAVSRIDRTWTPATAATIATIIDVVATALGWRSEARNPAIAKAAKPAAASANERRTATIPRSAPTTAAMTTIEVSKASLSFVPKRPTTRSLAPAG